MKALILAGGLGTRLRPITHEIPKPLVPVKKQPIVNHIIAFLKRHGLLETGVIISAEHTADFARWEKEWGASLAPARITLFIEPEPMGTFGYMPYLAEWLGSEAFIATNGDTLLDFDAHEVLAFHEKHKPHATLALKKAEYASDGGVAKMEGPYIREFSYTKDAPVGSLKSVGFHIFEPDALRHIKTKKYHMIDDDILPAIAREGELMGIVMKECRVYDCGTMEKWERAIREW